MEGIIGEIRLFAGNFAPRSWALCQGQLLSINSNSALFSILGTIYGGDGRTSFALPDLRGRSAIGQGHGSGLQQYVLGERGGNEFTTLSVSNMPSHNHSVRLRAEVTIADQSNPTNRMMAATVPGIYADAISTDEVSMHPDTIQEANVGASTAFSNMPPYLGMNYIICLQGVYPSRS